MIGINQKLQVKTISMQTNDQKNASHQTKMQDIDTKNGSYPQVRKPPIKRLHT